MNKSQQKPIDPGIAECHRLATKLGYIKPVEGSRFADRSEYDNLMAAYFKGKTSTADLTAHERAQWATMLRSWLSAQKRKAS